MLGNIYTESECDRWWAEGQRSANTAWSGNPKYAVCPYILGSLEAKWWSRGYEFEYQKIQLSILKENIVDWRTIDDECLRIIERKQTIYPMENLK